MIIRRATAADIPALDRLLRQVFEVHRKGRPDLFRGDGGPDGRGGRKYDDAELTALLADDERPVFVAVAEDAERRKGMPDDGVLGYMFGIFQRHQGDNILADVTTLYIDDLCVDESARGLGVGSRLYRRTLDFARTAGCHNVTLNVWSCNPGAVKFYERMGLTPYKIGMEQLL